MNNNQKLLLLKKLQKKKTKSSVVQEMVAETDAQEVTAANVVIDAMNQKNLKNVLSSLTVLAKPSKVAVE